MKNTYFRIFALVSACLALTGLLALPVHAGAGTPVQAGTATKSAVGTETSDRQNGYLAVLYDNTNGLPTSEANAIAQTPDGFIWIGGYSGLVRYDGDSFYRFDATTGITSVVSLYVDTGGRLWIGTNDRGIALFENGQFRFWGKEEGLLSESVREIAEDGDGNIILATTQGLAYIDAGGSLHRIEDGRIQEQYVFEMTGDGKGTIYGLTLDGDVFVLVNREVAQFYSGENLPYGNLSSVRPSPDQSGVVYFGTEGNEVIRTNLLQEKDQYDRIKVPTLTNINFMDVRDGRLWLCSDSGIGYLDSEDKCHEMQGLSMNNSVDGMMEDLEGNLWFVSSRQGVMKIVKNRFTNISELAGLEEMVINTTCLYKGDLYVGTDNGLYILDGNYKQREDKLTRLLQGIRIRCIRSDSKGNLWLCTFGEQALVCLRADGSIARFGEKEGILSDRVRTMLELSNGDIAVASSGGVNRIRDGKVVDSYGSEEGISNTEILSLCEGENGVLYAGSDGNGIYVIDPEKPEDVRSLTDGDGLDSEVILMMKKDPARDGFWIVTGNSLAFMSGGKIKPVTTFPYSNNFDLFFGDNDQIWILASNGIYVVSAEALVKDQVKNFTFYNTDNGMYCSATANARSCLTEDGTLYIAGSGAVMSLPIRNVEEDRTEVRLAVPFVQMDDKIVYFGEKDTLTIPKECKRVTVYGYAFTYTLNDPVVSYQLEGFSDEVVTVKRSELAPVSYTNLTGREYKFHLAVMDSTGANPASEITVRLVKEKTLTEYFVFRLFLIAFIALLIVLVVMMILHHRTMVMQEKVQRDRKFMNEVMAAFAKAIDVKDKYTNGHSTRVAEYSKMIAERMGYPEDEVEQIHHIAFLHDIGKIAVPDEILNKASGLTEEEYDIMKKHARDGYDILKEIKSYPDMALGAAYHHEWLNGKGYPNGYTREKIPLTARIVAVADTFDAMNSTRPYRRKMPMEEIVSELKRISGTQLEPEIVKVLLELIEEGKIH